MADILQLLKPVHQRHAPLHELKPILIFLEVVRRLDYGVPYSLTGATLPLGYFSQSAVLVYRLEKYGPLPPCEQLALYIQTQPHTPVLFQGQHALTRTL